MKSKTEAMMKTPQERDNLDLLKLVCELHARSLAYGTKEMHDASVEARNELERRLKLISEEKEKEAVEFAEWKYKNRWFDFVDGKWNHSFEHGTIMSKEHYEKHYRKSTAELFQLYKSQQND